MRLSLLLSLGFASLLLAACSDDIGPTYTGGGPTSTTSTSSNAGGHGGTPVDAGGDGGDVDKAAHCAATFGQALTNSFGRLDGTVLAVIKPPNEVCAKPNGDHVILQVLMNGEAYRIVINIQSSYGDPNVRYVALAHALPGAAWSEGWHTGVTLDYVADLGVHANANGFTPHPLDELATIITDAIALDDKVSVYATSSGGSYADSAHLIHRNDGGNDGAIFLGAAGPAPRAMLFHFADQTF